MTEIKVDSIVGSIGTVLHKALNNQGIEHEFGALDQKSVVIGIMYSSLVNLALEEINNNEVEAKIKEGILFIIYPKGASKEELDEVNNKILKKLTKYGIDAKGFVTTDGEAILTIDLNNIATKILDVTIEKAKMKLGGKMRLIRVLFAHDDKWGYLIVYRKGERKKVEIKPDDLSDLAV